MTQVSKSKEMPTFQEPEETQTPKTKRGSISDDIKTRKTPETVLAFCGALGAGVSLVADTFQENFSNIGYSIERIKISDLITEIIQLNPNDCKDEAERIEKMQEEGNRLRKDESLDILAQYAIRKIAETRISKYNADISIGRTEPLKIVWFIDSIKHPSEVELLRIVYGSMFYLIGVLCPEDMRKERLTKLKNIDEIKAMTLIKKDKSEKAEYGQKLIETIQYSDFFINNSTSNTSRIKEVVERFTALLFGQNLSPTKNEHAMFIAKAASYRSACLSRQVGASIMKENGEIITTGCNDVPCKGGGLYSYEHREYDCRCYNYNDKSCSSDFYKSKINDEIDSIVKEYNMETEKADKIKESIKSLTEYSRAVHAEMDAIIMASRIASVSLVDSTMFVTTFPCHNCAKHIVAAGIKKVYYIEPYEKSLASALHSDSLSVNTYDTYDKVVFLPFEGVAPGQYARFFQLKEKRKENGKAVKNNINNKLPISEKFLDRYLDYETKVIKHLDDSANNLKVLPQNSMNGDTINKETKNKIEYIDVKKQSEETGFTNSNEGEE